MTGLEGIEKFTDGHVGSPCGDWLDCHTEHCVNKMCANEENLGNGGTCSGGDKCGDGLTCLAKTQKCTNGTSGSACESWRDCDSIACVDKKCAAEQKSGRDEAHAFGARGKLPGEDITKHRFPTFKDCQVLGGCQVESTAVCPAGTGKHSQLAGLC